MLNASFSQTSSSQTSLNIAVGQIVARHLNDDGIVQEREVFHELAPVPLLTSQISHPPAEADIYDFVPSNLSMPAIVADNPIGITIFGTFNVSFDITIFP